MPENDPVPPVNPGDVETPGRTAPGHTPPQVPQQPQDDPAPTNPGDVETPGKGK